MYVVPDEEKFDTEKQAKKVPPRFREAAKDLLKRCTNKVVFAAATYADGKLKESKYGTTVTQREVAREFNVSRPILRRRAKQLVEKTDGIDWEDLQNRK